MGGCGQVGGAKADRPHLGSDYRVCLVDGEQECPAGQCVMRCSGDSGYQDSQGQLVYVGRGDRQIKRAGHRVNLDKIQVKCL